MMNSIHQTQNKGKNTSDRGNHKDEKKSRINRKKFHMALMKGFTDLLKGRKLERETCQIVELVFVFLKIMGSL